MNAIIIFHLMNVNASSRSWSWTLLAVASLIFAWAKWPDLSLPLFWDEIGVYGPGVLTMIDDGIGLLPSSLEPELSRGHPLLFYAFYAIWGKVFGISMLSLHLPGLLITLAIPWSLYWIGQREFGPWIGVIAGLTFLAMPAVFAQAGLVLPEMLLSLWLIWGLYHLRQKHWGWYALFGSLAILTKESAILLPLAGVLFLTLPPERPSVRHLLLCLIPIAVFGLFLLIQRMQNGWFFFPYHTDLISFDWDEILLKAGMMLNFLFVYQGRWLLLIILAVGGILFLVQRKSLRLESIHGWFRLSGIFLLGFMCFSVLNAYMDRYHMVLLALLALGAGMVWKEASMLPGRWKHSVWLVMGMPALMLFWQGGEGFRYDVDISYRHILEVQKQACTYMMETIPAGDEAYANFPLYSSFQDPRFGFVEEMPAFGLTVRPKDSVSWVANFQPGVPWTGEPLDSLEQIREFAYGVAACVLYAHPEGRH